MAHYEDSWRIKAVLLYGKYAGEKDAAAAAAHHLRRMWGEECPHSHKALSMFVTRTVQTFKATGSVHDRPVPGRPHKLTAAELQEGCDIIKQGYTSRWRPRGCHEWREEHKWFTSMREACMHSERLRYLCGKYMLDTDALLRHLRNHDSSLVWRRLDFKASFTPDDCKERQSCAREQLGMRAADPTLVRRIVHLDAGSLILCAKSDVSPKVLCDAHDEGVHSVLPHPSVPSGKPIKLRFYVAVCAVTGALCLVFYSGTTGLKRTQVQGRPLPSKGFKVSITIMGWG